MNKQQFLEILSQQLAGEIPTNEIYSNMNYYSQYIDNETASGKSEAEVLDALGDPYLIAKTLIDADIAPYRSNAEYEEVIYKETPRDDSAQTSYSSASHTDEAYEDASHSDTSSYEEPRYEDASHEDTTRSSKVYHLDLSTWYGKAIVIVLAVIAVALLVTVVSALLPFVLILVVVGIVISYFKRR